MMFMIASHRDSACLWWTLVLSLVLSHILDVAKLTHRAIDRAALAWQGSVRASVRDNHRSAVSGQHRPSVFVDRRGRPWHGS